MGDANHGLTDEQARVKERFITERNYWSELYDDLLRLDPAYLDTYRELSGHPWREGSLDPKVKELVYIAIDCATTHLYNPGIRVHINNAFDHGASVEEILEVFELASVLGIHSITEGVPLLFDEAGRPDAIDDESRERMAELKREFVADRGYWADIWDDVLELDPGYFEAYMEFSAHPWNDGVLDAKVKELVYIAIDCSTTHLYNQGTRIHMENALEHGATREEIMEVLELTSVLGIHTITESVPILVEEAAKRDKLPSDF